MFRKKSGSALVFSFVVFAQSVSMGQADNTSSLTALRRAAQLAVQPYVAKNQVQSSTGTPAPTSEREAARQYSDKDLVQKLNMSDWRWFYQKPSHIINEIEERASHSNPLRAQQLAMQLLIQIEESGGLFGSYTETVLSDLLRKSMRFLQSQGSFEQKQTYVSDLMEMLSRFISSQIFFRTNEVRNVVFGEIVPLFLTTALDHQTTFAQKLSAYRTFRPSSGQGISVSENNANLLGQIQKAMFTQATVSDYAELMALYIQRSNLDAEHALNSMHRLNADQTMRTAYARIEQFNESSYAIESIIEEIAYIRKHAPANLLAALMPKILRLLELAAERGNTRGQQALYGALGSSGGGGGGGGSIEWSQLFSGASDITSCGTAARSAENLYRRDLLSSQQIVSGLISINSGSCAGFSSEDLMLNAAYAICSSASSKRDAAVLETCATSVFMPLARVSNPNANVRRFVRALFDLTQHTQALSTAECNIRITKHSKYDENELNMRNRRDVLYFVPIQETLVSRLNGVVAARSNPEFAVSATTNPSSCQYLTSNGSEVSVEVKDQQTFWQEIALKNVCAKSLIEDTTFRPPELDLDSTNITISHAIPLGEGLFYTRDADQLQCSDSSRTHYYRAPRSRGH